MKANNPLAINSPLGTVSPDAQGSPVGVGRIDPERSYLGIGSLLQEHINQTDQAAWGKIKEKIDHTYEVLDLALDPLEKVTHFHQEIRSRLAKGQKLLFKPNLVNPVNINPQTHDPGMGSTACTEWPFLAALMRWFREKLGVSYHSMALGEAATMMTSMAAFFSMTNPDGRTITPEAVMEGKSGNFYGGWGFYFVRKYLAGTLEPGAMDDPMKGYEESVAGEYIPTGLVSDKLMVYDLNRIIDDPSKGREVEVVDGVNYKSITLHKAIIGGSKADADDLIANPGCILINVPKLKVHAISLFTNVIKNLGIGLYPMQSSRTGGCQWDYSTPHRPIPGLKAGLPHEVWVPEINCETGLPKREADGQVIVKKTGGITATMIDVIKAVQDQDIFMIHVVDGIEAINVDHQGLGLGLKTPEGLVFAGLDPVAIDLLCARYMFSNVSLQQALDVNMEDGNGGLFPQAVPLPVLEGNNIVTRTGFDNPLSRDECFEQAEKRGLGQRSYYVVGADSVTQSPLISLRGHLGHIKKGGFSEVITKTLYYDTFKFPWDLQKTAFSYLEAADQLAGTSIKKEFLDVFDDDADGILTYREFGKKGVWGTLLYLGGQMASKLGSERLGFLKERFNLYARMLKNSNGLFNTGGYDILKEYFYGSACSAAFQISQLNMEFPDPFQPGLTCGQGKWPSFQLAQFFQMGVLLYGQGYPYLIGFPSLYANALLYADLTQNGGHYAGPNWNQPNLEAMNNYVAKAGTGEVASLDFTFYVPAGYEQLSGKPIPNVEITDDPARILTAAFAGGREQWPETRL